MIFFVSIILILVFFIKAIVGIYVSHSIINFCTNETYKIQNSSKDHRVIETIPGWAHDITNIGDSEMIVLLWANEIFDQKKPDTYYSPL